MKKLHKNLFFCLFVLCICYLAFSLFNSLIWNGTIPKNVETYNRLYAWSILIDNHYKETGTVVSSLKEMANVDNVGHFDLWGNSIIYKKYVDGTVVLSSLGADGKKGGKGEKADIVISCDPTEIEISKMFDSGFPESVNTRSKMQYIKKKILKYYDDKGNIPETISDLKLNHEYLTNDDLDYWDNQIVYNVVGNHITLISYGADQKKGEGFEGNLVIAFNVSESDDGKQ